MPITSPRMRAATMAVTFAVAALVASRATAANDEASGMGAAVTQPAIVANDNRSPAGIRHGRHLSLAIEAATGTWHPDGDNGPGIPIEAFSEIGHAPQIPGPLIRIPAGTTVTLRIRNAIAGKTLTVYGLEPHPGGNSAPLTVAPGGERSVHFTLTTRGTYHYWATDDGSRPIRPLRHRFATFGRTDRRQPRRTDGRRRPDFRSGHLDHRPKSERNTKACFFGRHD